VIAACLAIVVLSAVIFYLLFDRARERAENARERRLLNACIQRPELAVSAHVEDVPVDDEAPLILGADGDFYRDGKVVT
jgi:hypothetical protein